MEKKHYIIITICVIVVIAAIVLWPKKKKPLAAQTDLAQGSVSPGTLTQTGSGSSPVAEQLSNEKGAAPVAIGLPNLAGIAMSPLGVATGILPLISGSGNKPGDVLGGSPLSSLATSAKNYAAARLAASKNFPLKKGSRGDEVKNVQRYINMVWKKLKKGKSDIIKADGIWGDKTQNAWKQIGVPNVTVVSYDMYTNQILPNL